MCSHSDAGHPRAPCCRHLPGAPSPPAPPRPAAYAPAEVSVCSPRPPRGAPLTGAAPVFPRGEHQLGLPWPPCRAHVKASPPCPCLHLCLPAPAHTLASLPLAAHLLFDILTFAFVCGGLACQRVWAAFWFALFLFDLTLRDSQPGEK